MLEFLKQFPTNNGFVNCPSYKSVSTCAIALCELKQSMRCFESGWDTTETDFEILGAMLKNVHCLNAELDDAIFKLVCTCTVSLCTQQKWRNSLNFYTNNFHLHFPSPKIGKKIQKLPLTIFHYLIISSRATLIVIRAMRWRDGRRDGGLGLEGRRGGEGEKRALLNFYPLKVKKVWILSNNYYKYLFCMLS